MCFVVFCGVVWVFCGCFVVFCECFLKNSVLQGFADVLQCFGRVLWMFFVRHFLSERKMHGTVLRCIAQSVFCSFCAFCILFGLFCAVLWKTLKQAHKTPQNTTKHRKTLFLKNIHNPATWPPAGTWRPSVIYAYIAYCMLSRQI